MQRCSMRRANSRPDPINVRNRMAHGYFDINLEVVWETVQTALPQLQTQLTALRPLPDSETQS